MGTNSLLGVLHIVTQHVVPNPKVCVLHFHYNKNLLPVKNFGSGIYARITSHLKTISRLKKDLFTMWGHLADQVFCQGLVVWLLPSLLSVHLTYLGFSVLLMGSIAVGKTKRLCFFMFCAWIEMAHVAGSYGASFSPSPAGSVELGSLTVAGILS